MIPLFDHVFPSEVVTFMSDRSIDFARGSTIQKEGGCNAQQKNFLAAQLGFVPSLLVDVQQVHGRRVILATEEFTRRNDFSEEADGLVTNLSNASLVIRTADCLPVFMYDTKRKCLGLLHAGWRGSHQNIIQQSVSIMRQNFHAETKDLKVALGPAIRACCYQVGGEFRDYFPQEIVYRNQDVYLDLPRVNKRQLIELGVLEENIFDCGLCTCCDKRFFSYRREGKSAGRMISLMMLRETPSRKS